MGLSKKKKKRYQLIFLIDTEMLLAPHIPVTTYLGKILAFKFDVISSAVKVSNCPAWGT